MIVKAIIVKMPVELYNWHFIWKQKSIIIDKSKTIVWVEGKKEQGFMITI